MSVFRITVRDEHKRTIDVSEFVGTEDEMEKHCDKVVQPRWPDADVSVSEVEETEGVLHYPITKKWPEPHPLHGVRASLVETNSTGHRVRFLETKGMYKRGEIVQVKLDEWRKA